jgi:hypothetical protein
MKLNIDQKIDVSIVKSAYCPSPHLLAARRERAARLTPSRCRSSKASCAARLSEAFCSYCGHPPRFGHVEGAAVVLWPDPASVNATD